MISVNNINIDTLLDSVKQLGFVTLKEGYHLYSAEHLQTEQQSWFELDLAKQYDFSHFPFYMQSVGNDVHFNGITNPQDVLSFILEFLL